MDLPHRWKTPVAIDESYDGFRRSAAPNTPAIIAPFERGLELQEIVPEIARLAACSVANARCSAGAEFIVPHFDQPIVGVGERKLVEERIMPPRPVANDFKMKVARGPYGIEVNQRGETLAFPPSIFRW